MRDLFGVTYVHYIFHTPGPLSESLLVIYIDQIKRSLDLLLCNATLAPLTSQYTGAVASLETPRAPYVLFQKPSQFHCMIVVQIVL